MVTLKRLPVYALFVSPFVLNFALALLSLLAYPAVIYGALADNVVGRGGYGEVYCGILDDGRAVAVKRLAATAAVAADEKKEKDFLTELGTVGHVRHPNVSSLLGCCVDRGLHLVFEFSTRGSVSANLHGESRDMPTCSV
jgi:serine/threonine protein kinase